MAMVSAGGATTGSSVMKFNRASGASDGRHFVFARKNYKVTASERFVHIPCQNNGSGRSFAILRSGGALRDRPALSKAANWGKLHPNDGLSGKSRFRTR